MAKKARSEEQILRALHQAESGERVADICREHRVSEATFYVWKKKYSGLALNELRELRQLRKENGKLKRLVADLSLDRHMLQEIVRKKLCRLIQSPWQPLSRGRSRRGRQRPLSFPFLDPAFDRFLIKSPVGADLECRNRAIL
jgi:putative transposase